MTCMAEHLEQSIRRGECYIRAVHLLVSVEAEPLLHHGRPNDIVITVSDELES